MCERRHQRRPSFRVIPVAVSVRQPGPVPILPDREILLIIEVGKVHTHCPEDRGYDEENRYAAPRRCRRDQ
ncbi:hypothetical protein ACFDTO_06610 [Microbacteriaceae bacterium 4G12]